MKITIIHLLGSANDKKTVHVKNEISEAEAKEFIKISEYSDYKVLSVERINVGKELIIAE